MKYIHFILFWSTLYSHSLFIQFLYTFYSLFIIKEWSQNIEEQIHHTLRPFNAKYPQNLTKMQIPIKQNNSYSSSLVVVLELLSFMSSIKYWWGSFLSKKQSSLWHGYFLTFVVLFGKWSCIDCMFICYHYHRQYCHYPSSIITIVIRRHLSFIMSFVISHSSFIIIITITFTIHLHRHHHHDLLL